VDPNSVRPSVKVAIISPMQWTNADIDAAGMLTVCGLYNRGFYATSASADSRQAYSADELRRMERVLKERWKLSARDIELLRKRNHSFGTGQSFVGLVCSMGRNLEVNKSFYQGIGHQWQAVLSSQYVYLRGDGTPTGMRVTSWN